MPSGVLRRAIQKNRWGEGKTMKVNKLIAVPAIALAAGIGLAACGTTVVQPAPVKPAATTPAATTPAAAAPAPKVIINNNNNPAPAPARTVYVPVQAPAAPAAQSDPWSFAVAYTNDVNTPGGNSAAWNLLGSSVQAGWNSNYNTFVAWADPTSFRNVNEVSESGYAGLSRLTCTTVPTAHPCRTPLPSPWTAGLSPRPPHTRTDRGALRGIAENDSDRIVKVRGEISMKISLANKIRLWIAGPCQVLGIILLGCVPTSNSNFNTTTYSMSFNGEIVAGWAIFFLVVATILASISLYRFVRPAAVRPPAPPLSADPSYPYQMPVSGPRPRCRIRTKCPRARVARGLLRPAQSVLSSTDR